MSSNQANTLTLSPENTKPHKTSDTGMLIRSPYKEWDPDRILISPPEKRESANKKSVFYECPFQYNYKLADGSEMKVHY
jgi:hypothetical protein